MPSGYWFVLSTNRWRVSVRLVLMRICNSASFATGRVSYAAIRPEGVPSRPQLYWNCKLLVNLQDHRSTCTVRPCPLIAYAYQQHSRLRKVFYVHLNLGPQKTLTA